MTNWRISANERSWVEFLRMLTGDQDPAPNLRCIQALRCALNRGPARIAAPLPMDTDIKDQDVPFASPVSADPSSNPQAVTASKATARGNR